MLRNLQAAALIVLGSLAAAPIAHASWMVPPAPYRPKDFTLVKKDGVYHIFYIRRDVTLPGATERDFGHAISTDLYQWTQLPPVLTVRDSSWDNKHVWAPSILERDGVYYLFYTGVTNQLGVYNQQQRMGVATSTDLMTWNRMDEPVLSCAQVPWTTCDTLSTLPGFRDPFVMPDPTTPGRDLMYYTATANLDSSSMVVGVAGSNGDLASWSDLEPLWATYRTHTGSGIVESPHVFQHGGLWYLFFTTGSSQPLAFVAGPDPLAGPDDWPYFRHVGDVLGFNTFSWFASEHLKDGTHDYFAFVNADRIEMYEMQWQGPVQFTLNVPDLFHVIRLHWAADTASENDTTALIFETVNGANRSAEIEAFTIDSTGAESPAPLDSLGLPASIPMDDDIVSFPWVARRWPSGAAGPVRLGIRVRDATAVTPAPVTVLVDTTPPPPDTLHVQALEWTAPGVRPGDVVSLRVTATNWSGRSVSIQAWKSDPGGGVTPVPLDSLGLPAEIPLTGVVTLHDWTARVWPATEDTTRVMRLNVTLLNGSLATGPLRVGPDSVVVSPDTAFRVTSLAWEVARVKTGDPASLRITSLNAAGRSVAIEAFLADTAGTLTPAPLELLELPFAIPLDVDTTRFYWTAKRWGVAPEDTMRLVVRLAGDTLGTLPLEVEPDSIPAPPDTAFRVTSLAWTVATVTAGQIATLSLVTAHGSGRSAAIVAYTLDAADSLVGAPLDSLGLPGAIAVAGDTTLHAWISRTWPDTPGPPKSSRVVIEAVGFGIRTLPLTVLRDSLPGPAPPFIPAGGEGAAAAEEGIRLRRLSGMLPSGGPQFLVELDAPTRARLDVFDVMGRRVRNLADRVLPAGASVLPWDGRDADGRAARAGIYFARLTTPGAVRIARAVLLP